MQILYEDNHLLAVNKPALLPTMGVAADRPSLLAAAKDYIKDKYNKPGNVYLGVVSRLDAPVTGVVLFARTSKAAARLNEQFRTRSVEKLYLALVEGSISPESAQLCDYLKKDERHRRVHIVHQNATGAQAARLQFRCLRKKNRQSRLEIELETGRKHQIRVQMAGCGYPIVGDRKYGAKSTFPAGIALHAHRLAVEHPVRREPLVIQAELPTYWPD